MPEIEKSMSKNIKMAKFEAPASLKKNYKVFWQSEFLKE